MRISFRKVALPVPCRVITSTTLELGSINNKRTLIPLNIFFLSNSALEVAIERRDDPPTNISLSTCRKRLSKEIKTRNIITYSKNQNKSDIKITSIKKNKKNTEFSLFIKKNIIKDINGYYKFKTNLLGEHNILNSLAAISIARELNISIDCPFGKLLGETFVIIPYLFVL